jgi:hexokinase
VDRDILFSGESSETLNTTYSFDTSYMYVCEADGSDTLEDTRIVLEDMLDLSKTTVADREVVKKVCELVGTRAATLVGTSIAAIVQHMVEKGIGISDEGYAICKLFKLFTFFFFFLLTFSYFLPFIFLFFLKKL